ncbi:hypothetical protein HDU96_008632 [Phlyctochytrium bullatum]|nr:hypothetical protein HDU96_008632 [Phlyctochytrium bullatum]
MAATFDNRYRWRRTEKQGTCWVCNKPSPEVLVSGENADWFYICLSHIQDRAFCKQDLPPAAAAPADPVPSAPSTPPAPPADKPASLPGSFPDAKDAEPAKDAAKDEAKSATASPTPKPKPPPGPKFFILHDNFFYLRQAQKRKKAQEKDKGALLSSLAGVVVPKKLPGGTPGGFPS